VTALKCFQFSLAWLLMMLLLQQHAAAALGHWLLLLCHGAV